MVVLLEAQHQFRAMGEEFLLQGSESRAFRCFDPAHTHTLKNGSCSLKKHLSRRLMRMRQTPVVPLRQSESACCAADLVLVKAGHQFSVHFDVRTTVASLFVIIGS